MILRTLMFFIVMGVFFIIYVLVIFGVMILNGDFQEMIEAQKAAKETSGN